MCLLNLLILSPLYSSILYHNNIDKISNSITSLDDILTHLDPLSIRIMPDILIIDHTHQYYQYQHQLNPRTTKISQYH